MNTSIKRIYQTTLATALALLVSTPVQAQVTPAFRLSQSPLTSGAGPIPNLLYVHDDSGSMYWSFMPDGVNSNIREVFKSARNNHVYYNPAATYLPPPKPTNVTAYLALPNGAAGNGSAVGDGTLGNAEFTNAWFDGYDYATRNQAGNYAGTTPRRVNLSNAYRATYYYGPYFSATYNEEFLAGEVASVAHYYNCTGAAANTCTRVNIDINNAAQKQNFANWYAYYRTRNMAARAGVGLAFADIGEDFRLGWGKINKTAGPVTGKTVNLSTIISGVELFTLDRKNTFLTWLYKNSTGNDGTKPQGSTPLRRALDDAGKYYDGSTGDAPWKDSAGLGKECRKSYTILMTDGFWSDGAAYVSTTAASRLNVDKQDAGNGYKYTTPPDANGQTKVWSSLPFYDDQDDLLADIAYYWWRKDLLPSVANKVVPTSRDPAFWQHMTTYTIGLGVTPTAVRNDPAVAGNVWAAAASETSAAPFRPNPAWVNVDKANSNSATRIDDLIHAAVNGHGGSASAQDPQEFADAMKGFVDQIKGSSPIAPVAATSGSLRSSSFLYEATYTTSWRGELKGYALCAASDVANHFPGCTAVGKVIKPNSWQATIPAANARKILLCNNTGVTPTCSDTQISTAALPAPLLYKINQQQWDTLRNNYGFQPTEMGDLINSAPTLVANENYGYARATSLSAAERSAYSTRVTTPSTRPAMIYIGANDGLLHAFRAGVSHSAPGNGQELFAYLPNAVHNHLYEHMTNLDSHRFLVDGSPRVGDVNLGSAATPNWHTVLVGSTGAGGNGYFAIDVENPNSPKVLWEITPNLPDFKHLGATLGQASIVRLQNGTWVAIFGNGYHNEDSNLAAEKKAVLYVVNIKTGARIAEIIVNDGDNTRNGLSTPLAADTDQDGSVDTVYAGDMHGNLWKFNMNSLSAPTTPLFKAVRNAAKQPIFAEPNATSLPSGRGTLVVFGTGKFFERKASDNTGNNDISDMSVQSFYGVLDDGTTNLNRTNLVEQTLHQASVNVGTRGADTMRYLSGNVVNYATSFGFYIDLIVGNHPEGERVTYAPVIQNDTIIFSTLIPPGSAIDPCSTGATTGWIMVTDLTGGNPQNTVFDLNGDGTFNTTDNSGGHIVAGVKVGNPGFALVNGRGAADPSDPNGDNDPSTDYTGILTGPDSTFQTNLGTKARRESWLQLKGR